MVERMRHNKVSFKWETILYMTKLKQLAKTENNVID